MAKSRPPDRCLLGDLGRARALIAEFPDYDTRLATMEADAERYWSER